MPSRSDLAFCCVSVLAIVTIIVSFTNEYRQVRYGDPEFANLVDQCYSLKVGDSSPVDMRKLRRTLSAAAFTYPEVRAPLAKLGLAVGAPDYERKDVNAYAPKGLTRAQRTQICSIVENVVDAGAGQRNNEAGRS